jgi:hypothetical protein
VAGYELGEFVEWINRTLTVQTVVRTEHYFWCGDDEFDTCPRMDEHVRVAEAHEETERAARLRMDGELP